MLYATTYGTRLLQAKDFTTGTIGAPVPIAQAKKDALMFVSGFVVGPTGEYAFFGTTEETFTNPPLQSLPTDPPFFPDAIAVPQGGRFEMLLMPDQYIWALGSTSPEVSGIPTNKVWVSFEIANIPVEWEEFIESLPGAGGGGGPIRFKGPQPKWMK